MYRNTESPYSITGTHIVFLVNYTSKNKQASKQTSKLVDKEIRYVVSEGREGRWGGDRDS